MDGSPPGSPIPGILQARTPEWVAISFSNAWKWKVKEVKSLICVQLVATPWTAAHQAPPSMGFSRQEYWSGVPKQVVRRWFNVLNKGVYTGLNNPFTMCSLAHEFKLQPPVLSLSFDWISQYFFTQALFLPVLPSTPETLLWFLLLCWFWTISPVLKLGIYQQALTWLLSWLSVCWTVSSRKFWFPFQPIISLMGPTLSLSYISYRQIL